MAEALCGPSNALQTFKQHTGVDRTLQQDRLTSRESPSQGFRSNLGPNVGALDPEFDAFQAGHAVPPQVFQQQHFSPPPQFSHQQYQQYQQSPQPHFQQAPAGPDWANDFQRLAIAPQHVQQRQQQQTLNAASWHQDFMNQGPASGVQSPSHTQRPFGGMGMGMGMGAYARPMGGMNAASVQQQVANGKQKVEAFDEAAFEAAFEQAQRDMMGEADTKLGNGEQRENMPAENVYDEQQHHASRAAELERQNEAHLLESRQERVYNEAAISESDPVLLRIWEKRPPVYATIKLRSELDLGREADARPFLRDLEDMESSGTLTQDASEAKWCVDTLQRSIARDAPQEIRSRIENLIKSINERLMSSYPLLATGVPMRQENIWDELRAAGYTTHENTLLERDQQPEQQKEEQHQPRNDEDDMAETAGRLLERVADNSSEKFKNSQFLELMRRLRDREVRVEGDKMVETSNSTTITPMQATTADFEHTTPEAQTPWHLQDLDLGRNAPGLTEYDFGTANDHPDAMAI